jgi:hypothetical protein
MAAKTGIVTSTRRNARRLPDRCRYNQTFIWLTSAADGLLKASWFPESYVEVTLTFDDNQRLANYTIRTVDDEESKGKVEKEP